MEVELCGYYTLSNSYNNMPDSIYCNMYTYLNNYKKFVTPVGQPHPMYIELQEATYELHNLSRLDEFRKWVDQNIFQNEQLNSQVRKALFNYKFTVIDHNLKEVTVPLEKLNKMLNFVIPVILLLVIFISFGISYYITSNNLSNIALFRILGISRGKLIVQTIIENLLICVLGILVGTFGVLFFNEVKDVGKYIKDIAIYLVSYMIGGATSIILTTRINTIQILTKGD